MGKENIPELWEWAEYYCPWCYVAAVRLHKIMPEYQGRVRVRQRAFPLAAHVGKKMRSCVTKTSRRRRGYAVFR